jgi:hypothetical protein
MSGVKKYFYFCGLPRSGNTLLGTILNQNPDINSTGHSFLPDLFFAIKKSEYSSDVFKNYSCQNNLNNVYKNIISNYYQNNKCKYIIERGDWITPYNYNILEKYSPNEIKIVILVRDVLEIIKSFLKLCENNPEFYINKRYEYLDHTTLFTDEIETKADLIMDKGEFINTVLYSIHQLRKNNLLKNFLLISYDDLTNKTEETLNRIYEYYEIKQFKHTFNNFKNTLEYNDLVLGADMHKIRTDKIKKLDNDIVLPQNVINKYKHLNSILFD